MHFTNRSINGQLQRHCTTLWNPTKAQISMKFSKHAWHVDPLDSFNHVWPSNRKGNWAAKEMLPNREVVVKEVVVHKKSVDTSVTTYMNWPFVIEKLWVVTFQLWNGRQQPQKNVYSHSLNEKAASSQWSRLHMQKVCHRRGVCRFL